MREIVVLGEAKFTLGFMLTGIRRTISINGNAKLVVLDLLKDTNVGIVIIDETTMESLDERTKEDVVSSIDPVFVTVSETAAQEELRKMILQSIGVDLLKGDD